MRAQYLLTKEAVLKKWLGGPKNGYEIIACPPSPTRAILFLSLFSKPPGPGTSHWAPPPPPPALCPHPSSPKSPCWPLSQKYPKQYTHGSHQRIFCCCCCVCLFVCLFYLRAYRFEAPEFGRSFSTASASLAMSTWQLELVFGSKAEEPSFPTDHSLTVVEKASVSCSSSSKV